MKHSINKHDLSCTKMSQKLEYKLNENLETRIFSLLKIKPHTKLNRNFYMILYWHLFVQAYTKFKRFAGETFDK